MKRRTMIIAGLLTAAMAGEAVAQTVGLGSTTRGGTSQIGRSIAAVISEHSGMQMRPQELANTADYMPLVNAGELEFGISNVVQLYYAFNGTGMSEGRPNKDLRLAAVLMPFRAGFIVPKDSPVQSVADLRGKNVPVFKKGSLGDHVVRAYLANAGMTVDDVKGVPVPNFPRMWDSFKQGSTDVTVVVVGSGQNRELDKTLGGVRFLSFDPAADKLAAMQEWLPQMYLLPVEPSPKIPGVMATTNVMTYDYTFFANKDVPDEVVYEAVKTLYEQEAPLKASGPFWTGFTPARMANDVNVPFHDGATKFYKDAGIWKR